MPGMLQERLHYWPTPGYVLLLWALGPEVTIADRTFLLHSVGSRSTCFHGWAGKGLRRGVQRNTPEAQAGVWGCEDLADRQAGDAAI